jgi:hypothetical protein
MNEFRLSAVMADDIRYEDGGLRVLPVYVDDIPVRQYAELPIGLEVIVPPYADLMKGDEISIFGDLVILEGCLAARVVEITLDGAEEDDDVGEGTD